MFSLSALSEKLGLGAGDAPPDPSKPMLAVHKRAKDGVPKGQGISIKYVIPDTFQPQVDAKKLWIGAYCEGEGLAVGTVFRPSDLEGFLRVDSNVFEAGRWYVFSFKEGETWPWITTYCTSSRVPVLPPGDEPSEAATPAAQEGTRAASTVTARPSPPKKSPTTLADSGDADTPPLKPRAADAGANRDAVPPLKPRGGSATRPPQPGTTTTAASAPKSPRRPLPPEGAPPTGEERGLRQPTSPRRTAEGGDGGSTSPRKLPEPTSPRRGSEPVRPTVPEAGERSASRLPPVPTSPRRPSQPAKPPPARPAADDRGSGTAPEPVARPERGQSLPPVPAGRAKRASAAPLGTRAPTPPRADDRRSLTASGSVNPPARRLPTVKPAISAGKLVECVVDYAPEDPTTELSACVGDVFEVLDVQGSSWLRVQHVDDHEICGMIPVSHCKLTE